MDEADPGTASAGPSTTANPGAAYFQPYQNLPIPVHSIGPDGLLLEVNEAWMAYTGYTKAEAIGRSFANFLVEASAALYRDKAAPELINTVPARESRSVEYRLNKANGEVADIVLTSRPERDAATGRFLHSLAVINDITARNRAEAALRQAQRLESLGRLTGGVAHDFNNLLMIILGSLQLLAKRLPEADQRATHLLDAARQGAERGAALTSRLLAFARQQELAPVAIDPRALLAGLRPMLEQLLGSGIAIEEDLPADLSNLCADPTQLELAVLNLAANARDAMPRGGRLRLAARNVTIPYSSSSFIGFGTQSQARPGNYVVLAVSDSGTGMDAISLARAADPFFTTKGLGKGTGLGLSIVEGFAVQSGGRLSLASRIDAGTTVELWLPQTTETACETAGGAPELGRLVDAPARRLRVLLVDDDPLVAASTSGMLEALGHAAVHTAVSGEAALAVLRQNTDFDLLLTDYLMPGMSGAELAAEARALCPSLPILLASGFAELDESALAKWPLLRKPYNLAQLAGALALALPR